MAIDMETYIVDRIEADFAVLECLDKTFQNVPLSEFSFAVREGNVVYVDASGVYQLDKTATEQRKKRLFALQKNIFTD